MRRNLMLSAKYELGKQQDQQTAFESTWQFTYTNPSNEAFYLVWLVFYCL